MSGEPSCARAMPLGAMAEQHFLQLNKEELEAEFYVPLDNDSSGVGEWAAHEVSFFEPVKHRGGKALALPLARVTDKPDRRAYDAKITKPRVEKTIMFSLSRAVMALLMGQRATFRCGTNARGVLISISGALFRAANSKHASCKAGCCWLMQLDLLRLQT